MILVAKMRILALNRLLYLKDKQRVLIID